MSRRLDPAEATPVDLIVARPISIPSHVCPGCGRDLAQVAARRLAGLGLRAICCPHCGRVNPLRSASRRGVRNAVAVLGVLTVQLLLACGLLLASAWLVQWAAADALTMPGCDSLLDLVHRRDPRTGRSALLIWLPLNSAVAILPVAAGIWLTFGLSHWGRPWLRISVWLAIQGTLLALVWAYPIADQWWRLGTTLLPRTDVFVAALELTAITAPLLAIFFPFERTVLGRLHGDSIISDLLRRRSRRRGLRHGKQARQ